MVTPSVYFPTQMFPLPSVMTSYTSFDFNRALTGPLVYKSRQAADPLREAAYTPSPSIPSKSVVLLYGVMLR